MGLALRCGDIAGKCDFKVYGETEEVIFLKIKEHMETFHGIIGFSKIINEEFRKFIRQEIPPE
ncbi:MAG: DUF1059 domain-containing protein [Deltaproteobacteria bacterium]|nr:DUF1059 domain-containing protein [Deltaproteobacteria bacterium]